jgi:alkylhydroperoxidase family enzyme
MPRLREIPRAEAAPDVVTAYDRLFPGRDPVSEPGTSTGTPGTWWTVFANAPDILRYFQLGSSMIRSETIKITQYQRELGVVRAGFLQGSKFVYSQHSKGARRAGISPEKVAAIPSWSTSELFDPMERALLAYTDELVLADGRVQDGTFAALKKHLSDEAILQFTYAVCMWTMYATISRALRLEYDDVDERVVEVPAPGEGSDVDIMAAISADPPAKG